MKGKIIVIEGTDCSGKETQSKLLTEKLNQLNFSAIRFSFPMYDTPTGKIVGGPYLGKTEICSGYFGETAASVDPKVSCLYYAADRKYNIWKIKEALSNYNFVILDRYISSNMAHQSGKIDNKVERLNLIKWIDKLEYELLELPKPDQTIFLHVPYEYAKELKKNRTSLDELEKNQDHLKNAEKAYLELAELYNWEKIECIKDNNIIPIEEINEIILQEVLKKQIH